MGTMAILMGIFGIVAALVGGAINMGGTALQNKFNKENIKETAELNYMYNEMSAEEAQRREEELYNSLYSPGAKMKQIQDAGLSPGLFYSGGAAAGTGGVNAPKGAGASGQHALPVNAPELFDINGAMNAAKIKSEIDLNKAQARKLNTDADYTSGVQTDLANATITQLGAQTKNLEAKTIGEKLDNSYKEVRNFIQDMTSQTQIEQMYYKTENIRTETKHLESLIERVEQDKEFYNSAYPKMIEKIDLENRNIYADTLLKGSQIELNEAQKEGIKAQIEQGWAQVCAEWDRTISYKMVAREEAEFIHQQKEYISKNFGLKVADTTIKGLINIAKSGAMIYGMVTGNPQMQTMMGTGWTMTTTE